MGDVAATSRESEKPLSEDFEIQETKPPLARRIRDFIDTLFSSRLVVQLRHDLNEANSQRDYFKGRAERLELLLTQPRMANRDPGGLAEPPRARSTGTVGGRKTWQQIISDRRKELAQLALDKQKKPETSAPAKPAQN